MIERLTALPVDFQIIALAGRNEWLLADYRKLAAAHPGRLFPLGFTTTIERVMPSADLAVTKPGGLTIFAQVEIQIEGAAGWAKNLPTWRIDHHCYSIYSGAAGR